MGNSKTLKSALFFVLGALLSSAIHAEPAAARSIGVSGTAVREVRPDIAYLDLGVQSRNLKLDEARRETNTRVQAILAVIDQLRIKPEEVDSASVNVNPEFVWSPDSGERRLQAYLVERRVRVRLTQLDKLGPLIERALQAGANQIAPPRFDHSRKEALRREVMTEAVRDARRNAEAAAAGVGMKPGLALRIEVIDEDTVGVVAPRVMMSAAAMDNGAAEASYQPAEINFRIKVTATFDLVE